MTDDERVAHLAALRTWFCDPSGDDIIALSRTQVAAFLLTFDEARAEIENLNADASNDGAYRESLKSAIAQLCDAIGIERGTENWELWIAGVRSEIARRRIGQRKPELESCPLGLSDCPWCEPGLPTA